MKRLGARWPVLVLMAAFFVPALGSRYYTFLANDVVIWALFATSLNLLVGYTGLVSFGHGTWLLNDVMTRPQFRPVVWSRLALSAHRPQSSRY